MVQLWVTDFIVYNLLTFNDAILMVPATGIELVTY